MEEDKELHLEGSKVTIVKNEKEPQLELEKEAKVKGLKDCQCFVCKNSVNGEYGCRFCLRNGEVSEFCYGHRLTDEVGNVVCPILSKYVCPLCTATGSKAHTERHCPYFEPLTSSMMKRGLVLRRNAAGNKVTTKV